MMRFARLIALPTRLRPAAPVACLAAAVVWLGSASVALAQDDEPSLDELLGIEPAEQPRERGGDAAEAEAGDEDDAVPDRPRPEPEPEPEPEPGAEPAGPDEGGGDGLALMRQAVVEMEAASLRLGRAYDPGIETQRMQQRVVDRLDQLIAQAKQQDSPSGGGGGGGQPDGSPRGQDAGGGQVAQQGQAGQGQGVGQQAQAGSGEHSGQFSPGRVGPNDPDLKPLAELRREWGSLPPRLRDELSEGLAERFSPVYRSLTEAYYRRLGELGEEPAP